MYRIVSITTGAEIGVVDAVRYIKVGSSGSYTPAASEDATGVAVNGVAYDLMGHDEVKGADTVLVAEFDGGALVRSLGEVVEDADAMNVDQEYRLTLLELGLSETDI